MLEIAYWEWYLIFNPALEKNKLPLSVILLVASFYSAI
jgi:hypothetical protein